MSAGAVAAALMMDRAIPDQIQPTGEVDFSYLAEYIRNRLPALAGQVLTRFPPPHDLFAGLNP